MQYTLEANLKTFIIRIKTNEANPIYDILPYIPHIEKTKFIGHDRNKRSFFMRCQEAVINCKIDTSNIM